MNLKLKYLPPIKTSLYIFSVILFVGFSNLLLFLYGKHQIMAIIIYSLFYAFFMIMVFIFTTRGFYMKVDEKEKTLLVHKPFSNHKVALVHVIGMELVITKKAYILSLSTKEDTKHYTLTGSLSFEEPLLLPFLRKMQKMEPNINLGENMHNLIHGGSNFDPWSTKMYYAYYTYIFTMITFYISTLLYVYILK